MQKLSSAAIAWRQCGQVVRPAGLWGIGGGAAAKPAAAAPPAVGRGRGGGDDWESAAMKSAAVVKRLSSLAYDRLNTSSSHLGTRGLRSLGRSVPAGRSPVSSS